MELVAALLLLLTAAHCTARCGFVQFRRFPAALRRITEPDRISAGVKPLEAAAASLAATIGTGNIAGVAGALLLAGPGVLFWMWVSAFLGAASKYTEILLSIRCRGNGRLGPMGYIETGLPRALRFLSPVYALLCAIACLTMGNLVQINAVSEAFRAFAHAVSSGAPRLSDGVLSLAVGLGAAGAVAVVELGGAKRVGRAACLLVPVMSVLYIAGALAVIVKNASALPAVLRSIWVGAWEPAAFLVGISRGIFSHEAGLGTSAVAHSLADTDSAHRQALFGIFEVFFDTVVICTVTALAVLTSGVPLTGAEEKSSGLVVEAFSGLFGAASASALLSLSLLLFAFSSILSFSLYGSVCMAHLTGQTGGKAYRLLFLPLLVVGACLRVNVAWRLAEWANASLAVVNSAALLLLTGRRKRRPRDCQGGAPP